MASYAISLIAIAIIFYLGLIFESTATLMLGLLGALVLVLSFLYVSRIQKKFSASIFIPIVLAERNRPCTIEIAVTNTSKIPLVKMRLLICYGTKASGKLHKKKIWLNHVAPGETHITRQVTMSQAGSYYFEIKRMDIYDISGLFYRSKKSGSSESAVVLPDLNTIPVSIGEAVRNFIGDSDIYDETKSGFDPSETFDIRSYQPGDKLQSVHWKLSAKMDDLYVREDSLPKSCPVVLLLDPAGCNDKNFVHFLEWAASLSFSLTDAKCAHFVAWRSERNQDVIRARVDDEESFYYFLTQFIADCMPDVEIEYDEKYRRDLLLHKIVLYGNGKIKINEQLVDSPSLDTFELIL